MSKKPKSGLKPIVTTPLKHEVRIVAKNGVDAKLWAREQGLKASQWRYAAMPQQLTAVKDREDVEVVFVPGWELRPDSRDFSDVVANSRVKVIAA